MSKQVFDAVIQESEKYKNGMFVYIPFDVFEVYGKKRVKIIAKIDDAEYRGSIVNMGTGHMLLMRKDIRAQIGKTVGDTVHIEVEEDTVPRVVIVPEDFQVMLDQHPVLKAFYEKLSYTHQREYIEWITSAKRQETRERRMNKVIEMMSKGQKGR